MLRYEMNTSGSCTILSWRKRRRISPKPLFITVLHFSPAIAYKSDPSLQKINNNTAVPQTCYKFRLAYVYETLNIASNLMKLQTNGINWNWEKNFQRYLFLSVKLLDTARKVLSVDRAIPSFLSYVPLNGSTLVIPKKEHKEVVRIGEN